MADTGWGIEPIVVGGVPQGTSAQDVRKIWASLYSPGVVTGLETKIATTNVMTYTVLPGVAVVKTSPKENVIVPFSGATITVPTTGATSRTDTIYIEQTTGTTNNAVLKYTNSPTSLGDRTQIIGQFIVPPNSTSTSRAVFTGSVPFSVPYGADLGLFYSNTDKSTALIPKTAITSATAVTGATGSFNLATDRKVIIAMDTCLSAERPDGTGAVRFDNAAYCEAQYEVWIDGIKQFKWATPGLHQSWATYHFEEYVNLTRGTHTVSYKMYIKKDPGYARRRYSGEDASTGTTFVVRDGGFWESGVPGDAV